MTWLSTWPAIDGRPAYREHPTEQAAEAHAHQIIQSGTATVATIYELVLPDEGTQP